ncbi:hypothetical protein TWF281_003868 [Arthrobotrys megalospora]
MPRRYEQYISFRYTVDADLIKEFLRFWYPNQHFEITEPEEAGAAKWIVTGPEKLSNTRILRIQEVADQRYFAEAEGAPNY